MDWQAALLPRVRLVSGWCRARRPLNKEVWQGREERRQGRLCGSRSDLIGRQRGRSSRRYQFGAGPGPNQESAGYQSKSIANAPTTPSTPPRTSAPKRVMQGSRSATSRCCVDARVQLPSHPAARRRSGPTWGAIRHLGGVILAGGTRKVNAMTWCFTCLDDRRILTGDHKTGIARLECGHYTTHHDNDR